MPVLESQFHALFSKSCSEEELAAYWQVYQNREFTANTMPLFQIVEEAVRIDLVARAAQIELSKMQEQPAHSRPSRIKLQLQEQRVIDRRSAADLAARQAKQQIIKWYEMHRKNV